MPELKFETGLTEYDLNGKCKVYFNPTDPAFAKQICDMFDTLDAKQKAHEKNGDTGGNRGIFDEAQELDKEMRNMIDGILGASTCDTLFGNMNVYAFASGLPVWTNLLFAIMDEIHSKVTAAGELTDSRIAEYISKYHK